MTSLETSDVDGALACADELAENGRWLAAIDELTTVYGQTRDHRVARRLVELRHAAFDELPKSPGRPTWPAIFADPFPGRTGIVEVAPEQLTGELVGGAINHHGCLRINGLLDPSTAEHFRGRIEAAFEARQRLADGTPPDSASPWFVPFEPGRPKAEGFGRDLFVRAVDAPDALCELVEIFTETGIRRAISEYLAERPAMIANKWVLRRSDSGMLLHDFHQDGAFLGEGIRTIDCWIAALGLRARDRPSSSRSRSDACGRDPAHRSRRRRVPMVAR